MLSVLSQPFAMFWGSMVFFYVKTKQEYLMWKTEKYPHKIHAKHILQCIDSPLAVFSHLTVHTEAQKQPWCEQSGTLQMLLWLSVSHMKPTGGINTENTWPMRIRQSQVHLKVLAPKQVLLWGCGKPTPELNLDPGSWGGNTIRSWKGPGVMFPQCKWTFFPLEPWQPLHAIDVRFGFRT